MNTKMLLSANFYPTELDLAKAITLAKREHCTVRIDCKRCLFDVNENTTLDSAKQQIETLIYR